ncbi:MAG: type I secretion C-terminal target domain-containing protein [Alphaproteobacteria bacterium]|nr:type I secretion C-terminal target domain-containing protein [Alphaproteobacteria bacterium]
MATFDFFYTFPSIGGSYSSSVAQRSGTLLELLRGGAVSDAGTGSFAVANTAGNILYRLVVGGADLTYLDGRPVGGTVTSLRLFLASGLEVARIEGLALDLAQALAIPGTGSTGAGTFHALLHAGDDLIRLGRDFGLQIDGGPGADTIFGTTSGGIYQFDDPRDRLVLPADGDYGELQVTYGVQGQVLSFQLGSGRFAGLEALAYGGLANVRIAGSAASNFMAGAGGDDTLSGGGGGDALRGGFGDDSLLGGAGDDDLSGGTGQDTLLGGAGHDILNAQETGNRLDGGSGDDLIYDPGGNTVLGGAGADTVYFGDADASLIRGGSGNDFLFPEDIGTIGATAHTLDGGAGNDTLHAEAGLGNLLLGGSGNDSLGGAGTLDGGSGNDTISAEGLLLGGAGDDLITMVGNATVRGGTGRDLFRIETSNGVIEDFQRGLDRIDVSGLLEPGATGQTTLVDLQAAGLVSWVQVESGLLLTINAAGSTRQVLLRGLADLSDSDFQLGMRSVAGTAGGDVIFGGVYGTEIRGLGGNDAIVAEAGGAAVFGEAGNDTITSLQIGLYLDGGTGNDWLRGGGFSGQESRLLGGAGNDTLEAFDHATLEGGAGNDLYLITGGSPTITEQADGGIDTVGVVANHTLGENFENLMFLGTNSFGWVGTGNGLANRITSARVGGAELRGEGGNDTLTGGRGRDTLDGGEGADRMIGGNGDDLYIVDQAGDRAAERFGEGRDTVRVAGDLTAWTLGANLENLEYAGTGDFRGTGNGLRNLIRGGVGADSLSGGGGNDTLQGGAGADLLTGGTGADHFRLGLDGVDTIADFSRSQGDRLDLTAIFPARAPGVFDARGLQELLADGYLRFEQAGGNLNLFVDADGAAGAGAEVQVAILRNVATLTEADFQLA